MYRHALHMLFQNIVFKCSLLCWCFKACAFWHNPCLIESMVCNVTTYNFTAATEAVPRRSSMWDAESTLFSVFLDGVQVRTCRDVLSSASQKDSITSFAAGSRSTVKTSIVCRGIAYRFLPTISCLSSVVIVPCHRRQHKLENSIFMKAKRLVGAIRLLLSRIAMRREERNVHILA